MLIEYQGVNKLVEIKSSITWTKSFSKNLEAAAELFDSPTELYLVYAGNEEMKINDVNIIPATRRMKILE